MAKDYDLIVIGAGTAARVAAMRLRKAGKSVAVIDSRPYGGTCRRWQPSIWTWRTSHDKGRPKLNEFLQSVSNPAIYVAGDAAQIGPPLTPVSSHDGKVVAGNILEGNPLRPDYLGVPSVAFTLPPIASVGMSEAEARDSGIRFRVKSKLVPDWAQRGRRQKRSTASRY